ncbi:hypothetical protein ILUMI_25721 [Ignelater luminosus]|uniref:NADH dehydrogenase [ubiquinone] 1 beta subcomplex subunit 2, mitochondrial n=1 Tax=Ignelater luminosus TaxID=2038154 RepID=A0A8K0C9D9_IGNLU|nr:hypothetical protein ILUMI_25721 [Ignelater luminosus]
MLVSRGAAVVRTINLLKNSANPSKTSVRNSHAPWHYRSATPPETDKRIIYIAEAVGGFAWWWMLWHLWTQFDHITGEFEYPDPRKWSDEELGIPPEE